MPMVNLVVNGRPLSVPGDFNLLQTVRAAGFDLPTLCYLDGLTPYGACRLCLVAITAPYQALVASCTYPVEEGLVVETEAPQAVSARRLALEFLLSRCPQSEAIRALAAHEGVTCSRFPPDLKGFEDASGLEVCVLCGLCVRVCRELVGAAAIGFIGRGADRQVGAPFHMQAEVCIGCGACAAVCPTGAVKIEDMDGQRVLRTWNTSVPLKPCPLCGRPYAPEPMTFLRDLVEASQHLWGICPACRRKAAAAQFDVASSIHKS
jgi:predicted molibdopterin-dependent oxidoreductase YjgC